MSVALAATLCLSVAVPETAHAQSRRPPKTKTPSTTVTINTSPLPGRWVTGAVAGDLAKVRQLGVSGGCVGTLSLAHSHGVFDVPVLAHSAAGPCALTFTVEFNDGSPAQSVGRTYNVNALAGGPNLIRAVPDPRTSQVVYFFDKPVRQPAAGECIPYPEDEGPRFSVITDQQDQTYSYFGVGVRRHPVTVQHHMTDPTAVVTVYRAEDFTSARLATIRNGAVALQGSMQCSYASNAGLPGHGDGTTAKPDLLSASASISSTGSNVVRYTFDQMVSSGSNNANRYAQVYNSELFLADGGNNLVRPLDHGQRHATQPSACSARYVTAVLTQDTIEVTNCYRNTQVQGALLGVTQPMPPQPYKNISLTPGPNYQPVNTDGVTPSHPEAAATLRR